MSLKRIAQFIKNTGEHCVVFEGDEEPLVIMSMSEYEALRCADSEIYTDEEAEEIEVPSQTFEQWKTTETPANVVPEEPWYRNYETLDNVDR